MTFDSQEQKDLILQSLGNLSCKLKDRKTMDAMMKPIEEGKIIPLKEAKK